MRYAFAVGINHDDWNVGETNNVWRRFVVIIMNGDINRGFTGAIFNEYFVEIELMNVAERLIVKIRQIEFGR